MPTLDTLFEDTQAVVRYAQARIDLDKVKSKYRLAPDRKLVMWDKDRLLLRDHMIGLVRSCGKFFDDNKPKDEFGQEVYVLLHELAVYLGNFSNSGVRPLTEEELSR